jgi:hypothetical protein
MISECEKSCASVTRTASRALCPALSCAASSATPRHASSPCSAAEKNDVRRLRPIPACPLRQQAAPCPRPLVRRHPRLPGVRGATCSVPAVWCREIGEAPLAGGQSFLHQALCLLRRPSLPQLGAVRCGARTPPRLEDRQIPGNGVHARATPPGGEANSHGHWHRRNLHPEGTYLSHRRQRSSAGPGDLVRRHGPPRRAWISSSRGWDHANAVESAWP